MKKNIFLFWVLLSTLVGGVSCSSEELPANPTIVSPVSSLVMPADLFFLLSLALAMWALFWFHMNFGIVFSHSVKNDGGILMGVALNL